jgi:hypothetical protein
LPNLLSLSTYCVHLELRPLPSTGITRFQRYYEPLRLLQWRRPLFVSVARGIPGTPAGLPCCASPCVYMPCPLPRRAVRSSSVGLSDRPCQPSPISGRLGARIVIFEAFSDFTRVTACTLASLPKEDNCPWSFDGSVTLPAVQVATGVNRLFPGPDFHRLGRRTFARRPRYSSSFSCLMMPHPGSSIIQ